MKKILLTAFALGVFSFNLRAQSDGSRAVRFGIKGGLNAMAIKLKDEADRDKYSLDSRHSFHVGVMTQLRLADAFAIQPEMLFTRRQFTLKERTASSDETYTRDYIAIPVLAKLYLSSFYVEAGPQAGFLIDDNSDSKSVKIDYHDIRYELAVGLGIEANNGLTFGIRALMALNTESGQVDTREGLAMVSAGFFF